MQGLRVLRVWTATAVLAGGVAAGTLISVDPASATPETVTCTSLTGNLNTTPARFTLSGCSGNTGTSGVAEDDSITWANGQTTYLTVAAFPLPTGKATRKNCPTLSDRYNISDPVVGDTTGSIKVGGKASAKVCILNEGPDPWSLAPGSVFKLH